MTCRLRHLPLIAMALFAVMIGTAHATTGSAASTAPAVESAIAGPGPVRLTDVATVMLPQGLVFMPAADAKPLLAKAGNYHLDNLVGIIYPADRSGWLIYVDYDDAGYVKDDESADLHADRLMDNFRRGTASDNERRKQDGLHQLQIVGWEEQPHYDAATHHLIWGVEVRSLDAGGQPLAQPDSVNYDMKALGRGGYISFNLVTHADTLAANKPVVEGLISTLQFNPGKRYEDFNAKTDKVAKYGLIALIAGVAIKKVGLLALAGTVFAKFGLFFAKAFKPLMVAVAAFGAAIKRLFRRNRM